MGKILEKEKNRVVIVDEDPTILKMWEKAFRLMDCCRYCLTNDPKMAEKFAEDGDIDLLISEVVMNEGNGFELAEKIHKKNKNANIILTTTYNCDLKRFNLNNPRFHILYKPYGNIEDVMTFVKNVIKHEKPGTDLDEDSWSENDSYPQVMEWKL